MELYEKKAIYSNALASERDTAGFVMEGFGATSYPRERLRLESILGPEHDQRANILFWCPEDFPANVGIEWDFYPVHEPGLCMFFFAARGRNGEDLFAPTLARRTGEYDQYNKGDIDAYHVSYFRRKNVRSFNTCNLRKSYGFHLVAQGADPIPSVLDAVPPYHMRLTIFTGHITFSINDLDVIRWVDDGNEYGPALKNGKIGFRQMAPMIAEYANLTVFELTGRK
ncbi:MAG: DUF1961 family protein [Spirochaetaceae bacterium]|nr:MAG: DUF1961 family protein [Spirochaetaceae bacterium]